MPVGSGDDIEVEKTKKTHVAEVYERLDDDLCVNTVDRRQTPRHRKTDLELGRHSLDRRIGDNLNTFSGSGRRKNNARDVRHNFNTALMRNRTDHGENNNARDAVCSAGRHVEVRSVHYRKNKVDCVHAVDRRDNQQLVATSESNDRKNYDESRGYSAYAVCGHFSAGSPDHPGDNRRDHPVRRVDAAETLRSNYPSVNKPSASFLISTIALQCHSVDCHM